MNTSKHAFWHTDSCGEGGGGGDVRAIHSVEEQIHHTNTFERTVHLETSFCQMRGTGPTCIFLQMYSACNVPLDCRIRGTHGIRTYCELASKPRVDFGWLFLEKRFLLRFTKKWCRRIQSSKCTSPVKAAWLPCTTGV